MERDNTAPRIFVTGAAGFIGAALCRRLLAGNGECRVIAIDNLNDYYDVKLKEHRLAGLYAAAGPERFTFVPGSIADKAFLERVFAEYRPSVVVNLAAQAGVRYSIDHPDDYIHANILGFYHILEACRHSRDEGRQGVEHLVFASSSSVYGNGTHGDTDHPVSLYAATKKADEVLAWSYASLYHIPVTGLRFFTVYGPAGRPDMFYYSAVEKLRRGEKLRVFHYGESARDYTYIDDTVEGLVRVMDCPPAGEQVPYSVYDLGRGQPATMKEFLQILSEEMLAIGLLPRDFSLRESCELLPGQPGDVERTCADSAPFERAFGFRPGTSLRQGLREFLRWYKDYAQL